MRSNSGSARSRAPIARPLGPRLALDPWTKSGLCNQRPVAPRIHRASDPRAALVDGLGSPRVNPMPPYEGCLYLHFPSCCPRVRVSPNRSPE